jgi:hypothetical protein
MALSITGEKHYWPLNISHLDKKAFGYERDKIHNCLILWLKSFAQDFGFCCLKLFFLARPSFCGFSDYFCPGQGLYDQLLLNSPRVGRQQG